MGGNYEKSIYNQLMDVMARLDSMEKELHTEKIEHKEDIARLNKKIDHLTHENHILKEENARLKSILNHDSSNTSLPPSSDKAGSRAVNTYNGREKSSRKAGAQKGHKGTTLTKAEIEEKIRTGEYRHEIRTIGKAEGNRYITKYVLDLEVVPTITEFHIYGDKRGRIHIPKEYRSDVTYGPSVKALSAVLYSEGVMSNDRIAAFLNAASAERLKLSAGSIYGFCCRLSEASVESISHLENHMLDQEVAATDGTTVRINGRQANIRNFSVKDTVIYKAMKGKTLRELGEIDLLRKYTGTLIHEHETALYQFGTGHGECNVHLLRYLRKNTEEAGNPWSQKMAELLIEMNRERKKQQEEGKSSFHEERVSEYEKRYMELIQKGCEENKNTHHKYAKNEEKALLKRMEKYRENHLLFLHDFTVPFDNNMSERDLRKAKNREKMAGGFRKESGNEMYCAILTVIETLKRRNMGLLENVKKLFMGTPAIF